MLSELLADYGETRISNFSNNRDELYWTSQSLNSVGSFYGIMEYNNVQNGMWRSMKNGKWYEMVKRPNGTTGSRNAVVKRAANFRKIGRGVFYINTAISIYSIVDAINDGDYNTAKKSGLDITMGALATFGGPIGLGLGTAYFVMDAFFFGNNGIPSSHIDPTIMPQDNTRLYPNF